MSAGHRWREFEDLPADPRALTDTEMPALAQIWREQRAEMEARGTLAGFNARLRREWAIETGIIERAYTLDRGTTQTLIERGINADLIDREATDQDPELVARMIQDHADVLDGIFAFVKGERELTTGYVKELHQALLRNVTTRKVVDALGRMSEREFEKGVYKTEPNNPQRDDGTVHEYCPPEHVAAEMDRMIRLHQEHMASGVPVEVEAAWLHHVFTQIHPFPDGNGRVARALASLVFIRAGWFPLVVRRDDREAYIRALELADDGGLRTLVRLFGRFQRMEVMTAIEMRYEVAPPRTFQEAVEAVRNALQWKAEELKTGQQAAVKIADSLNTFTLNSLRARAAILQSEFGDRLPVSFFAAPSPGPRFAIEEIAAGLGYRANTNAFERSVHLGTEPSQDPKTQGFEIGVYSFAVGQVFDGIIAVIAIYRSKGSESPLPLEAFIINYVEDEEDAKRRYSIWLETALVDGLNRWRGELTGKPG